MSTTVTMISGRQHTRGKTPSSKALTSMTTETQQESELVLEISIHLLQQTRLLPSYSNRLYIPLDFDLLESHMPFYQSALGNRLEYEFTFNDYNRVNWATGDTDASDVIENISLEYDIVNQPELTRMISNPYSVRLAILYDCILRRCKIRKDKSDTIWNINLNVLARSMKGILMLFEDDAAHQPFARDTVAFYNPRITKVEVTTEGVPNQLFSQGMRVYQIGTRQRSFSQQAANDIPKWQSLRKTSPWPTYLLESS